MREERLRQLEDQLSGLRLEISQLRQERDRFREEENRFRVLVETIPHGVQEIDLEGTITFSNGSLGSRHASGERNLIGKSIFEFCPSEDDERSLRAYVENMVTHQPDPVPWFGRSGTKSGEARDVRVDWQYKRDSAGRLCGFLCVITDITQEKKNEQDLRNNLNLLHTIIESSPDAIYMKDLAGRYLLTNSAGSKLVGRDPSEVLGCTDGDFFPAEVASLVRSDDRRVLEKGEILTAEDSIETPEGSVVLHTVKSPYRDDSGRIVGLVGISRDITGRKRDQESLRRAHDQLEDRVRRRTDELQRAKERLERDIEARKKAEAEKAALEKKLRRTQTLEAVGRLAGGVAHDFNNLLGSVLGCLYAIRLEAGGHPEISEELDRAQELCKRGGDLTRQLLTVARRSPGSFETVGVGSLLEEIQVLLRHTLPKTIALSVTQSAGLPPVRVDRSLFTHALLNLALNAKDAMPDGGALTFSARRGDEEEPPGTVVVEVTDTGIGIPPELQERIFQPFFTTKEPGRGNGLGLSTAYATLKEGGGEIAVRSVVGEGSTFKVILPAAAVALPTRAADRIGSGVSHPLTDQFILVVEDEADVARLVTKTLSRHGYRSLAAVDGLEALEILKDRRGDLGLIVLDLVLPGLSGEKVYRLLSMFAPQLPVLFITGREDLAGSLSPGGPCLPKPFTDDEFLGALKDVLLGEGS